ncbi:pRL2-19 [Streptomyces globisporus]|uniref:pRL2-19 n=1 Tax=Streptomyces globisporus TaxID=1908 RepID=UPI0037F3CA16
MDFSNLSPEEMSHAMLVAILMDNGGSMNIAREAFQPDSIGGSDGAFHAISMEPLENGLLRISVQPRPDAKGSGMTTT